MRRIHHSSNAAASYRPRMASLTAADTSWSIELMLEEPANERTPDVSGAWPAVNSDTMDLEALLEEDLSELSEDASECELNDEEIEFCADGSSVIQAVPSAREDVVELADDAFVEDDEPIAAVKPPRRSARQRKPSLKRSKSGRRSSNHTNEAMEARSAKTVVAAGLRRLSPVATEEEAPEELSEDELIDVIEGTISLNDGDLEVLEPESTGRLERAENGTVLFYCRPGDSLPPALVPTNELPRFAVPRGRLPQLPEQLPQFSIDALPASPAAPRRMQAARLPQFSIPPEPVRKPRVPPVRLPRFPIEEMAPPRPRIPAPRRSMALPGLARQWPMSPMPWPVYQPASASGLWPVHQSGEIPACPHCREQMLMAAAWTAAPALFGWGMAHR